MGQLKTNRSWINVFIVLFFSPLNVFGQFSGDQTTERIGPPAQEAGEKNETAQEDPRSNLLYELFNMDMEEIEKNKMESGKVPKNPQDPRDPVRKMILASLELEQTETDSWEEEEQRTEKKNPSKHTAKSIADKWEVILNPFTPFPAELFENDPKLMEWIKTSPEPLYYAVKFGNIPAITFFGENGKWDWKRGSMKLSPLHFSMITGDGFDIKIVEFFLNHPKTNLEATNVWGENLFHMIFSAGVHKPQLLNLLFQPKYFVKISHLLNKTNNFNETPLDVASNGRYGSQEKAIALLEKQGALSSQDIATIKKSNEEREFNESLQRQKRGELTLTFQCGHIFPKRI